MSELDRDAGSGGGIAVGRPLEMIGGMLSLMLACTSGPPPGPRADTDTGGRAEVFLSRSVMVDGRTWRYRVFVPRVAAEATGMRPIILFLHGMGERGQDNQRQLEAGLGPYVRSRADEFPAIVVFPQAPGDGRWSGKPARAALAALDDASREFGGDPERTYLTGLSRGGYGTWTLALMEPKRFAALVPVCGGVTGLPVDLLVDAAGRSDPFATVAGALRHVPVWIFHGARDTVILPEQSRRMASALQAVRADVRYTEFPDADHNSWDPAYATAELWQWLFAQRLR